jgi:hypothetical protein
MQNKDKNPKSIFFHSGFKYRYFEISRILKIEHGKNKTRTPPQDLILKNALKSFAGDGNRTRTGCGPPGF